MDVRSDILEDGHGRRSYPQPERWHKGDPHGDDRRGPVILET
jgi:hypothetical protein